VDTLLIIMGALIAVIGYVWLLIACFSESVLWGVGALFIGPLALVFGILNWAELKIPTILYVGGIVLHIIGRVIA
jgi:hypothetical protein